MSIFQDDRGGFSMMRFCAFVGVVVGAVGVGAGIVAMFMLNPAAVGIAGVCGGLISGAMGLKWLQKREEVRMDDQ